MGPVGFSETAMCLPKRKAGPWHPHWLALANKHRISLGFLH